MLALVLAMARPADPIDIRVNENSAWKGAGTRDIKAVVASAAAEIMRFCPDRRLTPIIVDHTDGPPLTAYQPGPNGEIRILLTTAGPYWAQFSYQFSHELTHVLCRAKPAPNSPPNMWFEESLCMMGSMFAMRGMGETWKASPPYPNWASYGASLRKYIDDEMAKKDRQLPRDQTLAQWYRTHESRLRTGSTTDEEGRNLQCVVGSTLLPLFEASPENWPAVGYLNTKPTGDSTFAEYLDAWEQCAPEKYRSFIKAIRSKFES